MLNASQRRVNKNSLTWWYVLKTSWRCLEDVLKTSWRYLEDVFARRLEDVLKTSWRRMTKTNILVLTKTSSENLRLRLTYSSWSRRLQDVFLKTNVCWVNTTMHENCSVKTKTFCGNFQISKLEIVLTVPVFKFLDTALEFSKRQASFLIKTVSTRWQPIDPSQLVQMKESDKVTSNNLKIWQ